METNTTLAHPKTLTLASNQPTGGMGIDLMTLGAMCAQSGFFQDARDAAQAVVKIQYGSELGIGPIAAMQGIHVIKNKLSISAALMAALIKKSGRYDYRVKQAPSLCTVIFFEGGKEIGRSEFGHDDAKRAGLGGENYQKFPQNMYFARAMSNGARMHCADVFLGPIYTPEELGALVNEDGEIIDVTPLPLPETAHAPKHPTVEDEPYTAQLRAEYKRLGIKKGDWPAIAARITGTSVERESDFTLDELRTLATTLVTFKDLGDLSAYMDSQTG